VDFDDASGSDTVFAAWVECATQPSNNAVVTSAAVDNPPGAQTDVVAACPKGTVVYGGGSYSNSGQNTVGVNSTHPSVAGKSYSWSVDMDDASSADAGVTVDAVCGHKLLKYALV